MKEKGGRLLEKHKEEKRADKTNNHVVAITTFSSTFDAISLKRVCDTHAIRARIVPRISRGLLF